MEQSALIAAMLREALDAIGWHVMWRIKSAPTDMVLLLVSVAAFAACACRLDALQYRRHKLRVIVLHGALAISCSATAYHAWEGEVGVLEWSAVVTAIAWLVTSFKTWGSGGVPQQFVTRPGELDEPALRQIAGGNREGS